MHEKMLRDLFLNGAIAAEGGGGAVDYSPLLED